MVTVSKFSRRKDNLGVDIDEDSLEIVELAGAGSDLFQPYLDEVGVRVLDEAAGVVRLHATDDACESVGLFLFRTKAKVLCATDDTASAGVEVIDTGAADRIVIVAMNTATRDTTSFYPPGRPVDSSSLLASP